MRIITKAQDAVGDLNYEIDEYDVADFYEQLEKWEIKELLKLRAEMYELCLKIDKMDIDKG